MNCIWNITSNGQIDLVFLRLDTEDKQDKVFIHDGGSASAPVIGTLFGDTIPQGSFTSTFNNLFVRFESDGNKEYRGFLAEYRGRFVFMYCLFFSISGLADPIQLGACLNGVLYKQ